jgi:hypothetical protein
LEDQQNGNYPAKQNSAYDIATAIWQNVETKISVEDLCERLCENYEVTTEQCSTEVLAFLKELETRNLISVEG